MGISAGALRAGKAVIEVGLLVKPVERQLRALQMRLANVGRSFASVGSFGVSGGGFAGLRNLFIGSAATAAMMYPIKLAANIELASAQMSTFTGSAGASRDMLIELQKFSAVAFIPAEQLSAAAAMMIRYGISQERVVADTKALAVVAGGSTDEFEKLSLAYAQVASAGRLQGEEMRQFKNTAFNPLREIALKTGETMLQVKDRMEAGTVSFEEVANALQGAVGAGGRFNGMLQNISNTLLGQFNKALAQLKLAILPIGEDALKPLTEFFKKINMIIPQLAEFIKTNVKWFTGIMKGAVAVAGAAVAFVTFGLALGVASIALGGIAALLAAVSSAVVFLAPIIGVLILAMRGLGIGFADVRREVGLWFGVIVDKVMAAYSFVARVAGGILDAMAGGDFKLAGAIAMAALNAAWMSGLAALQNLWINFKFGFLQIMASLVGELKAQWINFTEWFQKQILKISLSVREMALKAAALFGHDITGAMSNLMVDQVSESVAIQRAANRDRAALEGERNAVQAVLAAHQALAQAGVGGGAAGAMGNLNALLAQAAALAAGKGAALGDFGLGMQVALGSLAGKAEKSAFRQPEAFFDTRLAKQMSGGTGSVQAEQLETQKKIEKNTRNRGGMAFV